MKKNNAPIISLDDFGANEKANSNILQIVSLGKADRVAVMTNGEIASEEINSLLSSGVKLDSHLDITSYLEKDRQLKKGALGRIFLFIKKYISGEISPGKVKQIWEKQICDFQSLFGKAPDGLNSHEHVHFFPPYFNVATELARKYSISYVRFGTQSFSSLSLVSLILNILRIFNKKKFLNSALSSSTFVVSFDWMNNFDFKECEERGLNLNDAEIIFHPEREEELAFLKNSESQ